MPLRSLSVRKMEDQSIDAVHCKGFYVHSTDTMRSEVNKHRLLICLVKPHKPVSGSTVARWIKKQLEEAWDTSIFSAHSTRCAAASASAWQTPINIERIGPLSPPFQDSIARKLQNLRYQLVMS
jgi:hypothetical protein